MLGCRLCTGRHVAFPVGLVTLGLQANREGSPRQGWRDGVWVQAYLGECKEPLKKVPRWLWSGGQRGRKCQEGRVCGGKGQCKRDSTIAVFELTVSVLVRNVGASQPQLALQQEDSIHVHRKSSLSKHRRTPTRWPDASSRLACRHKPKVKRRI